MAPANGLDLRSASSSLLRKGLDLIAILLRFIIWPIRRVSEFLLPPGEYDGLSPAVTEKAAQQFIQHLKSLVSTTTQQSAIDTSFSSLGFEALRQEAMNTHSLIVVYLHSPLHRHGDSFLKSMILSQSMLEFLNQDSVKAFGSSIHTSQGSSLASQLGVASYPVFAMLQPSSSNSGSAKLIFRAEGPTLLRMQPNQLLPLLNGTYHRFQMIIAEEVARRYEREHEAALRRQQDEEYQETLRIDQERERQRQEERELEERRIRDEEEKERQKVEAERNRLDNARSLLRPEPTSGGTRIRFQLPSGKKLERRFENDESIASLKAFLTLHFVENNHPEIKNIALSTNFPKKNYDQEEWTLTECGLTPQAVLMVQDLDA